MCQEQNPRHWKKCTCSFNGLGATGTQLAISAGGAGAGLVTGAIIGTTFGGPIGTAVGAGIGIAASAIASIFTPDYKKIYATQDVNAIAAQMQLNVNGWNALPLASKVPAVQQFFITNYNNLWANLVAKCSDPSLGTAGQNCISQREPNGQYPFASYYLNPIQNDPNVHTQTSSITFNDPLTGTSITVNPDVSSITGGLTNEFQSLLSNGNTGYLEIGLVALGLVLLFRRL